MISNASETFVWLWLPGSTVPVVAGRIEKHVALHHFTYGRSYREHDDAIALSPFELPLQPGTFEPTGMNTIHSCLRAADARAMDEQLISAVQDNWLSICEEAGLATVERDRLWGRVLLNPYCLQDWESA